MLIKILLIILGLPILILPISTKIIKNKKLTLSGIIFLIIVILFAFLQYLNEENSSMNEVLLKKDKIVLNNKADSLYEKVLNLSDSLNNLKSILLSIDSQFYDTNNKIFSLREVNDTLNLKLLESDRPVLHLISTEITKNKMFENRYIIDFIFSNDGKRSATNVYGTIHRLIVDTLFYDGILPISRSDIYTNNNGFSFHSKMKFNPDSTSLQDPIYYYFKLTYSDLVIKTSFSYEIAMKLLPFTKGNFSTDLTLCENWETEKIKQLLEKGKTLPYK